ncbi:antibiotic biosynthesis monooxygenase [Arenibacter sp. TNZ]|jgi:heme-degrading monooxygenase HmoA|uniref:antibiotic biosynthesis monooxygenase family protein n=1 Tax=Arenibacter TaxID=178469 RepID=UPI000CD3EA07|nr:MULTISPECIES: antibiotic biosynthesis monooxygenase [Arenibacter]MCM4171184.1 antibiotic biosynthesis monooxygenase [Arenibacter sp. TNZ]
MELHKPYYAVIFTSTRNEADHGYNEMAQQMELLAKGQIGFLGFESAREQIGISVSYWDSLGSIADWKRQADHMFAQKKGREEWYKWYKVRICLVEREYEFGNG